ncbi:hypothetical protein I350_02501 [Cryptococcus amylolentus CBS 6273]|uniref:Uncharacterized protein n=1 Tax=Cryptococcus amylolentus CBS 6273 TaxID=1296118 RepID=A0A1E3KDB1_9TREE|nr:hypothetical protein I350_02501 [Cryptococcus amylolentus CBS 6273]
MSQDPSASSGPSGTQAGTSADQSKSGSATDTGPFPTKNWTQYRYQIDNTLFCPGDAATYSPEDVRKELAEGLGVPPESIAVTLLFEYKANYEAPQWDASYYNGAEPQGRKYLSFEPSTANASVPDELVEQIEEEKENIEAAKQLEGSLNTLLGSINRLSEYCSSMMEGDQRPDKGH